MIEDHAEEGIVVAQSRDGCRGEPIRRSSQNSHTRHLTCPRCALQATPYNFVIDETREAGPLWYAMDTFNSNDSGEWLMFFKPCIHLFENGGDDNDYQTFSTQTTHTFDVEAVSHLFVKSTGVTSYQVQTYVSGTWVTQETITPVQKTYRGYDNFTNAARNATCGRSGAVGFYRNQY